MSKLKEKDDFNKIIKRTTFIPNTPKGGIPERTKKIIQKDLDFLKIEFNLLKLLNCVNK